MVTEGIVLGHKNFAAGLEVDQAKVSLIKNLLPPTTVKGIRSFLGHVGFYKRFIRDFSKISRPLCRLLENNAKFYFDESYRFAFEEIKSSLVTDPIMETPDWNKEFEIMCCVMSVIMQWELYWEKELKRYSRPYTTPTKPSMRHKRTTLPQKKK